MTRLLRFMFDSARGVHVAFDNPLWGRHAHRYEIQHVEDEIDRRVDGEVP